MSLCACPNGPKCAWRWCAARASRSVMMPRWRCERAGRVKFMCDMHWNIYYTSLTTPLRGIDRPEHADDSWRPSLMDMMRHARIAMAFDERQRKDAALAAMGDLRRPGDDKFTPEQLQSMMAWRAGLRRMRAEIGARP